MVTMGVDAPTNMRAVELARTLGPVHAAVGHQPGTISDPDLDEIRRLAVGAEVVAIGEVGIDTIYPDAVPLARQQRRLDDLCALAAALDLPVSVHCQDSAGPVHEVLSGHPGLRGVMHYFSLDRGWAERFLALGMHLSFAGLLTRPSQTELREVARLCPANRLLLETDAPFGIPHGRRPPNRPAWLLDTAQRVADLRGIALEVLADQERANAGALFRLAV